MKKKSVNLPVIAVSVVAVCLVAIIAVLAVKAGNGSPNVEAALTSNADNNNYFNTPEESTTSPLQALITTTVQVASDTFVSTANSQPTAKPSTTKKPPMSQVQEELTVPSLNEDDMSHGSANSNQSAVASKDLPNDMSLAGLRRLGYDVLGFKDYIYNNDKDPKCMQKHFGYNVLYDAGASLIDFSIETSRIKFTYGDKDWMIQLWKGQYISGAVGTVGSEIGVYTRPKGTVSAIGHYNCAEEEDWLKMEMTMFWDEFGDGSYLPQFTRNYTDYWWATGFVDGQLANAKDSTPLRVLGRITFKDEEMATAFEDAIKAKGFSSVSTFAPDVIDTYKRHGKDIIFLWQDIR